MTWELVKIKSALIMSKYLHGRNKIRDCSHLFICRYALRSTFTWFVQSPVIMKYFVNVFIRSDWLRP